jgi:hypothetical protein
VFLEALSLKQCWLISAPAMAMWQRVRWGQRWERTVGWSTLQLSRLTLGMLRFLFVENAKPAVLRILDKGKCRFLKSHDQKCGIRLEKKIFDQIIINIIFFSSNLSFLETLFWVKKLGTYCIS